MREPSNKLLNTLLLIVMVALIITALTFKTLVLGW